MEYILANTATQHTQGRKSAPEEIARKNGRRVIMDELRVGRIVAQLEPGPCHCAAAHVSPANRRATGADATTRATSVRGCADKPLEILIRCGQLLNISYGKMPFMILCVLSDRFSLEANMESALI